MSALARPYFTIVFPARNEEEILRTYGTEVLPVLDAIGLPYEILVVDDGSTDRTFEIARALGDRVRVLRHETSAGLGGALRTAFREARGELVVTMDADLTFAPALVRALLNRFQVGDADVVSGSPKLAGWGFTNVPAYRIIVSRAATTVYSFILGRHITAISPILRLYRAADVRDLPLRATGFEINAEILFLLVQRGRRVAEIPAPLTQRIYGTSKMNYWSQSVRHVRLVIRMLWWRMRGSPATYYPPVPPSGT